MSVLYLQPSYIRYSQDSINNVFERKSRHSNTRIGETLDNLCERRCRIEDIPNISVVKKEGMWFTADNRRLWVFQHLERLAKCSKIPVNVSCYIPDHKFTTVNDGESVIVRGSPGGRWYSEPSPKSNDTASTKTGFSGRHTKLENAIEFKPVSKPPNRGEIHITAKEGIHTATEEPEVREPRLQMYKIVDHSVHTKSNPISSDRYSHIQYAPMIQTCADDDGTDVHKLLEEVEEQVLDENKRAPMATRAREIRYVSRDPNCCWCMIL